MGIKDLKKFLRDSGVDCFYKVNLNLLTNKKIAIDSLNWVFTYNNLAVRNLLSTKENILDPINQKELYEYLIDEFIKFNIKILNFKIIPVWIWDGKSKDNKTTTKVERRKSRKMMEERKNNLRNELLNMNILERPPSLLEQYRKLLLSSVFISYEYIEKIKNLSNTFGLPTIVAEDEAENLGSSLAVDKRIAAVWSADTDTLPLGCPMVIKGFDSLNGNLYIDTIFLSKILSHLEMSIKQFRDFCIMLGTDFNDRIPGLGPKKSLILINKYKEIETIDKETKHNIYCLKQEEVRPQLTPYKTTSIDDCDLTFGKNCNL